MLLYFSMKESNTQCYLMMQLIILIDGEHNCTNYMLTSNEKTFLMYACNLRNNVHKLYHCDIDHHSMLSHDATHDIDNGWRVQLYKLHANIQ